MKNRKLSVWEKVFHCHTATETYREPSSTANWLCAIVMVALLYGVIIFIRVLDSSYGHPVDPIWIFDWPIHLLRWLIN